MIVTCTRCQAKFRVADDKVGPRGAKVRCSKCQTIFLVHRDLGTVALAPPAAAASAPPPSPLPARPAAHALGGAVDLDPGRRAAPPAPASDPFALPADDPFAAFGSPAHAAPVSAAGPDPFSRRAPGAAVAPAPRAEPFRAGEHFEAAPPAAPDQFVSSAPAAGEDAFGHLAASDPFAFPAPAQAPFARPAAARPEPFAPPAAVARARDAGAALAGAADPFAAFESPREDRSQLPVTDLSALLGDPAAAPGSRGPAAPAPPPPTRFAAPFDPGEIGFDDAPVPGADLALEDRAIPPPLAPARAAADEMPEPDLDTLTPGPSGPGFDPSEVSFMSGPGDEPLALATDATPAPAPVPPPLPAPGRPSARAAPPSRAAAGGPDLAPGPAAATARALAAEEPEAEPATEPDRIPGGRTGRLRAVAVNAIALAVLLVVALAIRVAWRGEVPGLGGAPRPGGLLARLGSGGDPAATFAPVEVTNGLYERAKGPPLLFVRGKVRSHASADVPGVRVDVELVRDGQVIARGAALAGALPTPEELYGVADGPALDALLAAVAARAPGAVRPGDAIPFLVALAGAPPDLAGATLRVVAGAAP